MIGLLIGLILATIVCVIWGLSLLNNSYGWGEVFGLLLIIIAIICFAFSIVVFAKII